MGGSLIIETILKVAANCCDMVDILFSLLRWLGATGWSRVAGTGEMVVTRVARGHQDDCEELLA